MAPFSKFRSPDTYDAQYFTDEAVEAINDLHALGEIDDIENLRERAVYIVSGLEDKTVPPHNLEACEATFKAFDTMYVYLDEKNSGHGRDDNIEHTILDNLYRELGYTDSLVSDDSGIDWEDSSIGSWTTFPQQEFYPEITEERW